MSKRSKQTVSGDRFVGLFGGESIIASESKGLCLSKVLTRVERSELPTASGQVAFEPVIGPSHTVYVVRKVEGVTRVETINDTD